MCKYASSGFFYGFIRNPYTEDIFRQIHLHEEWFKKVHKNFSLNMEKFGEVEILFAHMLTVSCDESTTGLRVINSEELHETPMYEARLQKFMRALCIENFMERQPDWYLVSYKGM